MCGNCGCDHHHEVIDLDVEQDILSENNRVAEENRRLWRKQGCRVINLVSSPGSGKTTLLEATIARLQQQGLHRVAVIEGDQHTENDAERIRRLGVSAVQINTLNGCHLDARRVAAAYQQLGETPDLLFIENVGNLVCPAMFDLGEQQRVVIFSVTEGDDKPLKYPYMFAGSDVCIIHKVDLLPYLHCDLSQLKRNVMKINSHMVFFEVSAMTGEGMERWCDFLSDDGGKEDDDELF